MRLYLEGYIRIIQGDYIDMRLHLEVYKDRLYKHASFSRSTNIIQGDYINMRLHLEVYIYICSAWKLVRG